MNYIHSYLVRNNTYIIVFGDHELYNVYDMENDKWLLKENEIKWPEDSESRSLLINDEIIIISYQVIKMIYYFIQLQKIILQIQNYYTNTI